MQTPAATVPSQPVVPVPWWRVGVMWFFAGGLGAVVIGSFALLFTAVKYGDTVVPQDEVRVGAPNAPTTPAQLARNHSATPKP
jgi:hypothetical protein